MIRKDGYEKREVECTAGKVLPLRISVPLYNKYYRTMRYFILSGQKLTYKIKPDLSTVRGAFDLVPGCMVTEVGILTVHAEANLKDSNLFVRFIIN